jgi:heme/copper-type cytochrome/quinol oxidase subunit 4
MKISNKIVWISLIVLTIASFLTSKEGLANKTTIITIVLLSSIKFLSIGFQFMELKHAHKFWKIFFSGIILFYMVVVYSITL